MSTIGRLVRARRRQLGMTQATLAELSGVTQGHLSLIERGDRTPTIATLGKIRRALAVPDDEYIAWLDAASHGQAGAA